MIPLHVTRTSQPQELVEPSSISLARGLVSLPLFSADGYDVARDFRPTVDSAVTRTYSENGKALRGTTDSVGFNLTNGTGFSGIVPAASPFSVMLLVRIATTGVRRIFLGDFDSAGTNESFFMEQQSSNQYRFGMTDTAPVGRFSAGGSVTVGWHWLQFIWDGSNVEGHVDNVALSTNTAPNPRRAGVDMRVLRPGAYTLLGFDGDIAFLGIWNRAISYQERAAIRQNPWQLHHPIQRRIWVPVAGGGGVNVTANGATITATASISAAGAASAVQSPTVVGQVLSATASLIAGVASAAANATVAGVTLAVTATLQAGAASATGAATVAGQVLSAAASIISGVASAVANVSASGATITATASLIPGEAYVQAAGGGSGGWPKIGMKLSLGM